MRYLVILLILASIAVANDAEPYHCIEDDPTMQYIDVEF